MTQADNSQAPRPTIPSSSSIETAAVDGSRRGPFAGLARRVRLTAISASGATHPANGYASQAAPRRVRAGRLLHRGSRDLWIDCLITVVVVCLVASPMLLTKSGFAVDFTNHLWLVWYQERFIEAHLHPTFFLNAPPAPAFSPEFVFYGATLYTVTAVAGAILGAAPVVAFVGVSMVAIAAGYGGLLWLARQLGVRGLKAHAPSLVYVTSAYYVTNIYGRGAWPEFVATSMLPLIVAAAVRLARGRWALGPIACLVAGVVLFSGSHNITLLWGTIFLASAAVLLWAFAGRGHRLPWRRIAGVAALAFLAGGLNGWFLVPDVVHGRDTLIASAAYTRNFPTGAFFNSPGILFYPFRTVPRASTSPGLFVQAPVWFLAWALAAGVLVFSDRRSRSLRGPVLAMLAVLVGFLALIVAPIQWGHLPSLFSTLQFGYRLNTYVALASAGLVLIGVLAMGRVEAGPVVKRTRPLGIALAFVTAVSVALCVWQLWVPNVVQVRGVNYPNRNEVFASGQNAPRTWYAGAAYADASLPLVSVRPGRLLLIPPQSVDDDRVSATILVPRGSAPFATNIGTGPYFIRVSGVRVVGRSREGLVLARTSPGSGPVRFAIAAVASRSVLVGRLLSVACLLALLAAGTSVVVRRRR